MISHENLVSVTLVKGNCHDKCCETKQVGDKVYYLKDISGIDTSQYGCSSDCIYETDDSTTLYCFKPGDEVSECLSHGIGPVRPKQLPCPELLTIDHVNYRLIYEQPHTRCYGDIDKCVYTANYEFYCMDGFKPNYTPIEMWENNAEAQRNGEYGSRIQQNVVTGFHQTHSYINHINKLLFL